MADQNDLTTNVALYEEGKSTSVTTETDGSGNERLHCNMDGSEVIISDSESATKYQMKTYFDAIGLTLNTTTDDILFSVTGTGTLDFVAVTGSNANFEITIEVDGSERIRISMAELASIGLGNATNVPFWAETANKNFRYSPNIPVGYTTGFRIMAISTGNPLASVKHMTLYRERVT